MLVRTLTAVYIYLITTLLKNVSLLCFVYRRKEIESSLIKKEFPPIPTPCSQVFKVFFTLAQGQGKPKVHQMEHCVWVILNKICHYGTVKSHI